MKKLNVKVWCTCGYNSSIEVPDDMTLDEAIEYASDVEYEPPIDHDAYDEYEECEYYI